MSNAEISNKKVTNEYVSFQFCDFYNIMHDISQWGLYNSNLTIFDSSTHVLKTYIITVVRDVNDRLHE